MNTPFNPEMLILRAVVLRACVLTPGIKRFDIQVTEKGDVLAIVETEVATHLEVHEA